MALQDIKAHCEKDEARMDGAHAKVDKFAEEGKNLEPPYRTSGTSAGKMLVLVVAAIVIIAAFWFLLGSGGSPGAKDIYAPVISSQSFVNGPNGMRVWVNASDADGAITNVTILVSAKTQGYDSYFWPVVFQKVYWVNKSSVKIADVLLLGNLPTGDYRITAFATDESGKASEFAEYTYFQML